MRYFFSATLLVFTAACGPPLTDSQFGEGFGLVSAGASRLSVTPNAPVIADGKSTVTVSLVLRDGNNIPVPNGQVSFSIGNTASLAYVSTATTGPDGSASASFTSIFAGPKQITVHTSSHGTFTAAVTFTNANNVCTSAQTSLLPPPAVVELNGTSSLPQFVDMNGDGLLDIAFTNPGGNTVSIALNPGNGHFTTYASYGTDTDPVNMAICDLNNDSIPDVATVNPGAGTVSVLLGATGGTLGNASNFVVGPAAATQVGIVCADTKGDGNLSIITSNFANGTITILPGDGTGSFGTYSALPVSPAPWDLRGVSGGNVVYVANDANAYAFAVAAGNDPVAYAAHGSGAQGLAVQSLRTLSRPDIVTANTASNTLSVLLSDASGAYAYSSTVALPGSATTGIAQGPLSVATVDMNGDGFVDLVTQSRSTGLVYVDFGNNTGAFATAQAYNAGFDPIYVSAGDFNGDGKSDVAVLHSPGTLSILFNLGDGTLGDTPLYATAASPSSIAAGDWDGDGHPDLVVVSAGASPAVQVFNNTGNGKFVAGSNYRLPGSSYNVATTDINNDGWPDIVATIAPGSGLEVLLNQRNGTFAAPSNVTSNADCYGLAFGDFNGDGLVDIVAGDHSGPRISVVLAQPGDTFATPTQLNVGDPNATPTSVAVTDIDGDGNQDILVAFFSDEDIAVFLGNGDGTFVNAAVYAPVVTGYLGTRTVCTADFDADGISDVATADNAPAVSRISLFEGNSNGTLTAQTGYHMLGAVSNVYATDIDSDSIPDLISTDKGDERLIVSVGFGNGTFKSRAYVTGGMPTGAVFADFNGDGQMDAAVNNSTDNTFSVMFNIACP